MQDNNIIPEEVSRSFTEKLLKDVKLNQNALVVAMVDAAKGGDVQLLKEIIKQVSLLENKAQEEEKFKLTDEQFKQVILVAARRLAATITATHPSRIGVAL